MTYVNDLVNSGVVLSGLTSGSLSGATTGPAVDMVSGDGVCNVFLNVDASNMTAITATVYGSTASTGTYTAETGGTVSGTTNGFIGAPYNRNNRWQKLAVTFSGTTAQAYGFFVEGKKVF